MKRTRHERNVFQIARAAAALSLCIAAGCATQHPCARLPQDTDGLIHALASPNPEPTVDGLHIDYPPDYDETAQECVRAAERELRRGGFDAFPALVRQLDDDRYAYTECYETWRNLSVGEVCYYILEDQVEPPVYDYSTREAADGTIVEKPWYLYTVHLNEHLKTWWKAREGRSLRELQIEALEWTIEQERALGFKDKAQEEQVLGPLLRRLAELRERP